MVFNLHTNTWALTYAITHIGREGRKGERETVSSGDVQSRTLLLGENDYLCLNVNYTSTYPANLM